MSEGLRYQAGYGNHLKTEAREGVIPLRQNDPKRAPLGLFKEQINGSGFTEERRKNLKTVLYRLRPGLVPQPFKPMPTGAGEGLPHLLGRFNDETVVYAPTVQRYNPLPIPLPRTDWLQGLQTFAGVGDPRLRKGLAIHCYAANASMEYPFCNIDGDMLLISEMGTLRVRTELGWLDAPPGFLLLLPRGIRFQVFVKESRETPGATPGVRGWVLELFEGHLQLPQRGVLGTTGLADERHFEAPVADYEDKAEEVTIVTKHAGTLWTQCSPHSPFDVVGWHGTYAPFRYDLRDFMSMGSTSFDHPDPSIFTVMTHPLDHTGKNSVDVGAFVGRWDVMENTLRVPYLHRNITVEFNMVVSMPKGSKSFYRPGVFSYTPTLSHHGVPPGAYKKEYAREEGPERMSPDSLWMQIETPYMLGVAKRWLSSPLREEGFTSQFSDYPLGEMVGS